MELKKTFGSPVLWTVFCVLVLANLLLFWQGQKKENQLEIGESYLAQLGQCMEFLSKEPEKATLSETSECDKFRALFLEKTEEGKILEAHYFLASYKEAKEKGQSTVYYEMMYDKYITEPGIEIPKALADVATLRIRTMANRVLLGQLAYLSGYPDSVKLVLENAKRMGKIKQFAEEGSFSKRNIERTAEDFGKMADVEPELVPMHGVSAWLSQEWTDYFVLALLLLLVAEFFRERKKGLWQMVHACAGGRFWLGLKRIGVILAGAGLFVFFFYGIPLFLSCYMYGEFAYLPEILAAPVQSLPSFGQCVLPVTIGGFLGICFLLKFAVLAAFGVLFYAIMSFVPAGGAVLAVGAVLGFEFFAYRFIPVQSFTNVLKFINLFPLLSGTRFFTQYQNLNLFRHPVSSMSGAFAGLVFLLLCAMAAALYVQVKKYPVSGMGIFSGFWDKLKKKISARGKGVGIVSAEFYKQMVSGRGIWILFLFAALMGSLYPSEEIFYSVEENLMHNYCRDFEGEVTEKTLAFLAEGREKMARGEFPAETAAAFAEFDEYVGGLLEYEKTYGKKLSVVDPFGYRAYFSPQENEEDLWNGRAFGARARALLSVAAVVLLTAGLFPREKQNGIAPLLRAMPGGRGRLFFAKLFVALADCVLIWGLAYGTEFAGMVGQYGVRCPGAPLHSLADFREVPFSGSIAGYLVLLSGLRLLVLVAVAACAMAFTSLFRELRTAVLCAVLVFVLPMALHFIEIPNPAGEQVFGWLAARYVFGADGRPLSYGILAVAGIVGVWGSWMLWGRTGQKS